MKKIMQMLFICSIFIFTACGEAGTGESNNTLYPEEVVRIGVVVSDPTDSEVLEMQDYFNYLSQHLNVEFMFSEAIESAEEELAFIENCAISGVHGIIGYYNISRDQAVARSSDFGMFYYGSAEKEDVYELFKDDPFYLGAITYGEGDFNAGYELGRYLIDSGSRHIVYASGGADLGVDMFINRRNGFLTAVEEASRNGIEVEVIDVSGFPGDSFFADQSSALTRDIDAVAASFNGLDFWAQPIAAAGKTDTVRLATIGTLNQEFSDAIGTGSINFLVASNVQRFGIPVGMIINAVDGNGHILRENGEATNLEQGFWLIETVEEAQQLIDIKETDKVYSHEDILSLVSNVNPDADVQTLVDLVNSYTLEDILKRRAQ